MKIAAFTIPILVATVICNASAAMNSYYRGPLATETYNALDVEADSYDAPASFRVVPDFRSIDAIKVNLKIKATAGVTCVEEVVTQPETVGFCDPKSQHPCRTEPRDEVTHFCQATSNLYHQPELVEQLWSTLKVEPKLLSNGVLIKQAGQISVSLHEGGYNYGVTYTNNSWEDQLVAVAGKASRLFNVMNVPTTEFNSMDLIQLSKRTDSLLCMKRTIKNSNKTLPSFINAVCISDKLYIE